MTVQEERACLQEKFRLKFALDRVVGLALLPVTVGFSALVRLGMWAEALLDPSSQGPLFYVEERCTEGRSFHIFKYRTTFLGTQEAGEVGRVTRVGHLLKKWYLDELPQVLNVLRGDMTLVGPRPNVPHKARREIEEEGMRSKLLLRAGLTGLVQVYKGEARDRSRYRALEEEYLTEVSRRDALGVLAYDLSLLRKTVFTVLAGEGL